MPNKRKRSLPTYSQVGIMAKMCLYNGYRNSIWKLQTTTRTDNDFYLSSVGECYPGILSVYGALQASKMVGNYLCSLGWLTNQQFLSDLGVRGESFGGLWYSVLQIALATDGEYQLTSKLKCGFQRETVRMELEVPIYKQSHFMGYLLVAPADNFLLGYQTVFNTDYAEFDKHAFCLGFNNASTEVSLHLENFEELRCSIFQRIGKKWGFALQADMYDNMKPKTYSFGGQYEWAPGTVLKAKIRDDTRVGLIYQRIIRAGIKVRLHCTFMGKDPLDGRHGLGTSWYFNV